MASATDASWASIAAIGVGAFALVSAEFLPVGLLPQIASGLGISKGEAGLMITVPGAAAACSALLAISVGQSIDRRYVLWSCLGLMVLSNALVACAPGLNMLLVGRLLLGVAVGGFWTIAVSLGARLRPREAGKATSMIFLGVTLGTVAGVPAGTLLGGLFGWRMAFGLSAALAMFVVLSLIRLLPVIAPEAAAGIRHAPSVLKVRKVRVGLVAVVLIFIGHFAAYTYISPFLAQSHDAGSIEISSALLSYGGAGVFGNLFCGWLVDRDIRRAVLGTALLLGASMLFLIVSRLHPMATSLAVVAWGFAFGMLPIAIQSWIFRAAPERMETVTALFVAITQIAMGAGALLGGILVEQFGAVGAIWLGATASLAAAVWIYLSFPGEERIASIRSGR